MRWDGALHKTETVAEKVNHRKNNTVRHIIKGKWEAILPRYGQIEL
jgi:hypothetical protein